MKTFGLRGGYQPWNTLEAFEKANNAKLDGVHADVWLTSDDKLAVLHGGRYGELILNAAKSKRNYGLIYNQKYNEIKRLKQDVCLLEEVL